MCCGEKRLQWTAWQDTEGGEEGGNEEEEGGSLLW